MLQRHVEYLQRGQRLGSFSRRVRGQTYLPTSEKEKINKQLNEAEQRIDKMMEGKDVEIELKETQNCTVTVDARLSGHFTRELWQLALSSLRSSTRSAYSSSPLDMSTAYLLHSAGGSTAVKKNLLHFLAAAIKRKCSIQHQTNFLGDLQYTEDIEEVASRISPGSPLNIQLKGDRRPRVRFKRPYKGLNLRVPRKPYIKGKLFNLTENYLSYKFSSLEDYPHPQPPAKESDSLVLQVENGWFEEPDGSFGPQIPPEFISGNTTLDLVEPWIPSELLEAVTGISVGEIRTVRVSIPFTTAQLLDINARQMEAESSSDAYHLNSIAKQASAAANSQKKATGEEAEQEGRSLVPLYLKNIANTTKEGLFKSLLGEKKGTTDEETAATPTPKAATAASSGGEAESDKEGLKGNEENMGTQNSEEDGENEEIHHIDCLIQVKCLDVKRRIWPVLDDAFFEANCEMTRKELWDAVEAAGEEMAESAASKHALGAAAQALDEITQVEVPESMFEAQAEATWRQQVKAREFQGEKDKKTESKEEFEKWKEENRRGIENILRTAFAIQAVYQKEGLQVDETKLQRDLAKAMLQTTEDAPEILLKQIYKKAQASLVYDFILKNANVEYYIDDTPAEVTVQPEGSGIPQQGVRAFPSGVDVAEWRRTRKETIEHRDKLREQAKRFFVDPKTVRKFDQGDANKL